MGVFGSSFRLPSAVQIPEKTGPKRRMKMGFADWKVEAGMSLLAMTAAWWAYADASGLTRRKAQERIDERKKERQRKAREALGHASQRQRR